MRNLARTAVGTILGAVVGVLIGFAMYGLVHASAPLAITNGVLGGILCGLTAFFSSGGDRRSLTGRATKSTFGLAIIIAISPLLGDVPRVIVILHGCALVFGVSLGGIIGAAKGLAKD
ncbi:hypothetical protein [Spirillospora sp. CA-128828]|uniref:hypothetical protein n=1 Tax=Spirillospora sp. CA-128828 TaxID=3240033 RepID=UPI003D8F7254